MPTSSSSTQSNGGIGTLSESQRKALAKSIVAARAKGQSWDGESGICNDPKYPLVRSAIVGRKLVREVLGAKTETISKSYDRASKGLTGPRTSDAPKTKTAPKRKAPVAKTAPKTTRKRAPKVAK